MGRLLAALVRVGVAEFHRAGCRDPLAGAGDLGRHSVDDRGHHGGREDAQQDVALYYFGPAKGPDADVLLDQLQLAPTVLARLGVPVPQTMRAAPFLD